jgi:hypothetical protein
MPKPVATIDAVFSIDGRGTVIALPKEDQWMLDPKEKIYKHERIQIRRIDGRILSTFIKEIEVVNRGRDQGGIAFCLPSSITADEILPGSELWLERDGTEPLF